MNTIAGHYLVALPYLPSQTLPAPGANPDPAIAEAAPAPEKAGKQSIKPKFSQDGFTPARGSLSARQEEDRQATTPFSTGLPSRSGSEQEGEAEGGGNQNKAGEGPDSAIAASDNGTERDAAGRLDPARPRGADGEILSREEVSQLRSLKTRDVKVRRHEEAHLAAAGGYATGGAHFEYTRGPDGRTYAVGGRVNIDTSAEPTPEATIRKMRTVKRAALAPAQPSAQDRRVAAAAGRKEIAARRELTAKRMEEMRGDLPASALSGRRVKTRNFEKGYASVSGLPAGRLDRRSINLLV